MTHLLGKGRGLAKSRGFLLCLALLLGPPLAFAQEPEPGQEPAADTPAASPTQPDHDSELDEAKLEERFEDPKAKALLENNYPELFTSARTARADTDRLIESMANNSSPVDRATIDAYVQFQIAQITSKRNIAAMLDPAASTTAVKSLESGSYHLTRPLQLANASNNAEFRRIFTEAVVKAAPQTLKGHIYSRIMLMVALSRSGDPAAIPVLIDVLNDSAQPLAIRMLAAIGMTTIANSGKVDVQPAIAIKASTALANFLKQDATAFWPAQYRAVQAMGSIRQPGSDPLKPNADLAAAVLATLADPDSRPTVRAWAAWALGMIRPNTQTEPYNFTLLAHQIGAAAAQNACLILETDASIPERSYLLASLMLQYVTAFQGDPDSRNSGLLQIAHPSLDSQRSTIDQIASRVKAVARAAIELTRSIGVQRQPRRDDLRAAVTELLSFLEANPPADQTLYPDSPAFPTTLPSLPGETPPSASTDKPKAAS